MPSGSPVSNDDFCKNKEDGLPFPYNPCLPIGWIFKKYVSFYWLDWGRYPLGDGRRKEKRWGWPTRDSGWLWQCSRWGLPGGRWASLSEETWGRGGRVKYEHEVGNLIDPIDEQPGEIPKHQVGFGFLFFEPSLPGLIIQADTFHGKRRGYLHAAKLKSGVVVFGKPITCPAADFVRCLVRAENQRVSQNSQAPK